MTGLLPMRVTSLLCSLLLLVACSSNSSTDTASAQEPAESKYYKGLPATDMEVADESPSRNPSGDSGYTRQFVLEEEVVTNAKEAGSAIEARNSADFRAPVDNASGKSTLAKPESMPPMDKTYTLQLAAVREMQQAVEYAQRYRIDAEHAGVARILSKGELWYVLAYGVYTSREQADMAKAELQAKGVPEPWVRTLAALEALSKEAVESGF